MPCRCALQRPPAEAPCPAIPGHASPWKKGHLCLSHTGKPHGLVKVRSAGEPWENPCLKEHLGRTAIQPSNAVAGEFRLRCFLHSLTLVWLSRDSSG